VKESLKLTSSMKDGRFRKLQAYIDERTEETGRLEIRED
jgi:hypothetical protein